jgi:ABC-type glycerol-3-phosphate transport system substrate-binding protein
MYKKFLKPTLALALSLAMTAGAFTGCSSTKPTVNTSGSTDFADKTPSSYNGSITVWSFTDELKSSKFIDAFNKVYPNIKVNLVVSTTDNNEYQTKLATAMSANAGAPDVFLSEDTFVKEEINSPYADNLSAAPYNAESLVKGNMATYAVALGRDSSNELKALT